MIRDRNIDPNASFPLQILTLLVSAGASHSDGSVNAVYIPYRAKLVDAKFAALELTDADDSVKVKLLDDAVELMADTDPVAAGTLLDPDVSALDDIAAGSWIYANVTTAANDAIVGVWTLVLRPYLGAVERTSKSLV